MDHPFAVGAGGDVMRCRVGGLGDGASGMDGGMHGWMDGRCCAAHMSEGDVKMDGRPDRQTDRHRHTDIDTQTATQTDSQAG